MLNTNFAILGSFIVVLGGLSYLIDTIKGKVKPNKVTYVCWSIAPLIAFFAEIRQGVGIQSLVTFMFGFIPLLIFLSSFINKEADWKLNKFDLVCGSFSLFGLLLWYITKSGNIAILLSIFADFLASFPTIVKSFNFPETENAWPYGASVISVILTVFTLKHWNFSNIGFLFYISIISLVIYILIQFKVGNLYTDFIKRNRQATLVGTEK